MNHRDRLRRTGILCLHCLKNLAYLRAAHEARHQWARQDFWQTAHNNFLDIGVLEWCKLFGDNKAKHHWRKVVTDQDVFLERMFDHLRLTTETLSAYIAEMRTYRDKFIAHLDEENRMNIPNMDPAIKSAQFLYRWLLENEDDCNAFWNAPANPVAFFRDHHTQARDTYGAQPGT